MTTYDKSVSVTKKRNWREYRKIYESIHGEIPKDKDGRSFEIHHLDNDYTNNSPENLVALSIQDHYDIHWDQGDFGACRLIALRMGVSPEELSEICRRVGKLNKGFKHSEETKQLWSRQRSGVKFSQERLAAIDRAVVRERTLVQMAEGKNKFTDSEWQKDKTKKLIDSGRHNFTRDDSPTKKAWTCDVCGVSGTGTGNFNRWHKDGKCIKKK